MHKILFVYIFVSTIVHALYNPFFVEDKPKETKKVQEQVQKKVIYEKRDISKRKTIEMTYFGYVSSSKGKFALVRFNKKNIVITQDDKLYDNDEMFKIAKITSNYILLRDRENRVQTVYFSSKTKRRNNE